MLRRDQAPEGRSGEGSGRRERRGSLGAVQEGTDDSVLDAVQLVQVDREQRGSFEDHPLNGFQGRYLAPWRPASRPSPTAG